MTFCDVLILARDDLQRVISSYPEVRASIAKEVRVRLLRPATAAAVAAATAIGAGDTTCSSPAACSRRASLICLLSVRSFIRSFVRLLRTYLYARASVAIGAQAERRTRSLTLWKRAAHAAGWSQVALAASRAKQAAEGGAGGAGTSSRTGMDDGAAGLGGTGLAGLGGGVTGGGVAGLAAKLLTAEGMSLEGAKLHEVPAPTAIRRATVQVMREQASAAAVAHAAADGRSVAGGGGGGGGGGGSNGLQTPRATNAVRRPTMPASK